MNTSSQTDYIVVCPNCGKRNLIRNQVGAGKPICAACWTYLGEQPAQARQAHTAPQEREKPSASDEAMSQGKNSSSSLRTFLILIVGIVVVYLIYKNSEPTKDKPVLPTPQPPAIVEAPPSYPKQALPLNGEIRKSTNREAVAPLEIKTQQGPYTLVKLVDHFSKTQVLSVFLHPASKVKLDIPLGSYELRYALGNEWYGYEHLFGADTAYFKAEQIFNFKADGNQINGYSVTLYPVSHGNLRTASIRAEDF